MREHFLEAAAREFADATATPPFLYELGPDGARKVLDDVQAAPIGKPHMTGVRTTSVRYNGTLHDFMMLNPLRRTAATTGAIGQAVHVLRTALGTD